MILNHRQKTYTILSYEALFRKLKEKHRRNETLTGDYKRFNAGFRGEKNVDYKLSVSSFNDFFIFQDLRLNNYSHFFQIDTLILTEKFICILEIKNIKEKLNYDSHQKQFTQEIDGKIIAYKDPILQADTQKRNLEFWLQQYNINIPIETLVVSSNDSAIITNIHQDPIIYDKLIHSESLHFQLDKLKKEYTKSYLDRTTLKKISNLLLNNNTPHHPDLIQQYRIDDRHLIKGVPCSNCDYYPMKRLYKKWSCPKCSHIDFSGHKRVILDYFLLMKDTITNKECRKLLQIESPRTAYVLLTSMNLKQTGNNRGRKYHSPKLKDFPQDSYLPIQQESIFK